MRLEVAILVPGITDWQSASTPPVFFCDRAVIGGWPRTDEPILPYTLADSLLDSLGEPTPSLIQLYNQLGLTFVTHRSQVASRK